MKLALTSLQKLSVTSAIATITMMGVGQIQPASAANLVSNGNFEAPVLANNQSWNTFDSITGWKATPGGKIEVQRNAAGAAYEGSQLVELDSHNYDKNASVLGIFQDIATTPGQQYVLSFAYSARPNTGAGQNIFSVLFGDTLSKSFDAGVGGSQTAWNVFTTTVTASSALTRLQFNYEGTRDTLGAYIDDVKLEAVPSSAAVPEPTTMAGLALAGGGLSFLKRRKQKQVG